LQSREMRGMCENTRSNIQRVITRFGLRPSDAPLAKLAHATMLGEALLPGKVEIAPSARCPCTSLRYPRRFVVLCIPAAAARFIRLRIALRFLRTQTGRFSHPQESHATSHLLASVALR
jgi:hypothetical protein